MSSRGGALRDDTKNGCVADYKKLGTRVKDHAKNGASKRAGRGWGRKEEKKCFFGFLSLTEEFSYQWVCFS